MYSISKFAKKIGMTAQTLRDWDKKGILKPAFISDGKHRYYSEAQLVRLLQKREIKEKINIGYIRVSSKHQEDDLNRQCQILELFLAGKGMPFKIISDIGSGINYKKTGLKELLKLITINRIETICIMHKDRLVRFGFELIEYVCELHNVSIEIINDETKTDEQEMVEDIMNIIHVFSCRMNGRRSHINKKIMERLKNEK